MESKREQPLQGVRVIEFSHMVMGPSAGLILADLGADVIKVEPVTGDKTRELGGSGAGYFAMYNRNKRSIRLNLKCAQGIEIAQQLLADADVLIENFRPGAMENLGLGYADLAPACPRLIYCSARGFLAGPYENRTALDEVAQMMGGLAYMTGPPGRPLRAGASVVDVTGGMFGVIGILAALEARHRTGQGQEVRCSLFESTAFLVGQHMAQFAVTGMPAAPMPERISAWAIYDIFATADDEQVFVGVVSDSQWLTFCKEFELNDLYQEEALRTNADRVRERDRIMPEVRECLAGLTRVELMRRLEECGLPFAPVSRPEDLLNDPHLLASGGLLEMNLPDGNSARLPALPIEVGGKKSPLFNDPPRSGQHTCAILDSLGYSSETIAELREIGAVSDGS